MRSSRVAPLLLPALAVLVSGCGLKAPAKPQWSVTLNVPLSERSLSIADIASRSSYVSIDSTGTAGLHWGQDFDPVDVGAALHVASIATDAGAPLGTFEVTPDPPQPIVLDFIDLWPQAAGVNGQSAPVPPLSFTRTAPAGGFQSVQIVGGALRGTLVNSLPIPLDASTLVLANADGSGTLGTLNFPPLGPGESASASLPLGGRTVTSSWTGTWTASSPGSAAPVNIDDQAGVTASFAFEGPLVVSSAVAPLPAQTFVFETGAALPDTEKLARADFSAGTISLSLDNRWGVGGTLHLTLPDFHLADGSPLTQTFALGAARVIAVALPLAGASYVAADAAHPGVRVSGSLDSPGTGASNVAVASTDMLNVHADMQSTVMTHVEGIFAPFRVTLDPNARTLDIPEGLGPLGLADAAGTLTVRSTAGVAARITLLITGVDAAGASWALTGAAGGPVQLTVPAAAAGSDATGTLALSGANSNLPGFLGHLPRSVTITGFADVGGDGRAAIVSSTDTFRAHFDLSSALYASFSEGRIEVDPDSVRLAQGTRDQIRGRLQHVKLHVYIDNGLPLSADVAVRLGGSAAEVSPAGAPGATLTASVAAAAVDGASGAVTRNASQDVTLELSGAQLDVFQHDPIFVGGTLHLPGTAGARVRLRAQDAVRVRAWVEAEGQVTR